MNASLKHGAAATLVSAVVLSVSAPADAHPSFVNGGLANIWTARNTPTKYQEVVQSSRRGYWEDAIRVAHGCNLDGSADDVNDDPVVANTWIWPIGTSGLAPMSTGCDATGANCSGAGTQPSVARIPDASKKAHDPLGQGQPTTLAQELVAPGDVNCTTVGHSTTCTSVPSTTPISDLGQRMQFSGNLGYFKFNVSRNYLGGSFYAHKPHKEWTKERLIEMGISSAGAPYHNGIQVRYGFDTSSAKILPIYFSATSCARRLVIRPAGADLCKLSPKVSAYNDDPHLGNFWFGGPTEKFKDGHGIHENFWMNYALVQRDTKVNPYGANCKDKVNGDYDLAVMPTISEIDAGLPFPGFATKP